MRHSDKIPTLQESMKMGMEVGQVDAGVKIKGAYIVHLEDATTGDVLHHSEHLMMAREPHGVQ